MREVKNGLQRHRQALHVHIRLISEGKWAPIIYPPVEHLISEILHSGAEGILFNYKALIFCAPPLRAHWKKLGCYAEPRARLWSQSCSLKRRNILGLRIFACVVSCTWSAFFSHPENSLRALSTSSRNLPWSSHTSPSLLLRAPTTQTTCLVVTLPQCPVVDSLLFCLLTL